MSTLPRWHAASNKWSLRCGYEITKHGTRQRKWFYFDGPNGNSPPPDVIADAVAIQRDWQEIKQNWESISKTLAELDPETDYSMPVWYDRDWVAGATNPSPREQEELEKARAVDAGFKTKDAVETLSQLAQQRHNETQIIETLRAAGLLPKGISAPTRTLTIRQAINEYLDSEQERIDLKQGAKIQTGTFNTSRNNLLLCLGQTTAAESTEAIRIIDLDKPLLALNNKDTEAVAHHWFKTTKSRRTIRNYFGGFRAFLNWAELQDDLGFVAPKKVSKTLFIAGGNDSGEVTEPDHEKLKSILETASESVKLWVFFGVFCGFYQRDIASMDVSEVEEIKGETYITGFRSKENAEAKVSTKIKVTHWIPPEIVAVMRKRKAPKNKWGLYFLNSHGVPMFADKLKGGRRDNIGEQWHRLKPGLQFRQLRKWGWNWIPKHGNDPACSGETLSKRWAGQEGGGTSKAYRFSDYLPVIEAQKRWWESQLKAIFKFDPETTAAPDITP